MSSNAGGNMTRTAVITGASRGIGRNTAVSLARRGVDVIFTYHANRPEAESVVREIEAIGRKTATFQLNTGNTGANGERQPLSTNGSDGANAGLRSWGEQRSTGKGLPRLEQEAEVDVDVGEQPGLRYHVRLKDLDRA